MPLDNTVSIKDVITSLQTMEGINAKADLASVVGSPATADGSMTMINSTIQQAKNDLANKTGQVNTEPLQTLVDNTVIGKKWASGTGTGLLSGLGFIQDSGSDVGLPYLKVDDIGFVASMIIISTNTTDSYRSTILYPEKVMGVSNTQSKILMGTHILRLVEPAYSNETGFLLPATSGFPGASYTWYAFE